MPKSPWPISLRRIDDFGLAGKFEKIEGWHVSIFILIAIVWSLLVFPAISIRGVHYEEDTVVALARGAVEDGHWLVPHYYEVRFDERPILRSWLVAGLASIFGGINQWILRTPTVLALLLGAALVARLARLYASAPAALFGALCFLLCPSLLQRLVTAEPDVLCAVLQFLAFVIWWDATATTGPRRGAGRASVSFSASRVLPRDRSHWGISSSASRPFSSSPAGGASSLD